MEVVKRENIGGWTVSLIKCDGAWACGDHKKQCNDLSRGVAQFAPHFKLSSERNEQAGEGVGKKKKTNSPKIPNCCSQLGHTCP